jgi:Transposase DDE domain group 1
MADSLIASLTSVPSVAFDAGQLSSDGGLVWLAQADDRLGLSSSFSAQIRAWRTGPRRQALLLLLRQRLLQIACGTTRCLRSCAGVSPTSPARIWPASPPSRAWRMPSTVAPVIAWLTPRIHSRDKIALVSPQWRHIGDIVGW